eukprot:3870234-Prymnesium_polylepis.2
MGQAVWRGAPDHRGTCRSHPTRQPYCHPWSPCSTSSARCHPGSSRPSAAARPPGSPMQRR